MRVAVDMDGVLADWNTAFAQLLTSTTRRAAPFNDRGRYVPRVWDWPSAEGYTPAEVATAWDRVHTSPDWWEYLESLPGAQLFMEDLAIRAESDGAFEGVYLTSRTRENRFLHTQSQAWLERRLRSVCGAQARATVLVGVADKGAACQALGLTALIDDHPPTLDRAADLGVQTFLRSQPWNAGPVDPRHTILHTLDEFWEYAR